MINNLKWFDFYVKVGLKPIPIFSNTKIPVDDKSGIKWNRKWSVARWRPFFVENPQLNLGFLLGDIIDVEGDTVEANNLLLDLIGDIPHPTFKSSKSIHHLFQNPFPEIQRFVHKKIEFRAYLHQSIAPPSVYKSGPEYRWLNTNSFIFPELPQKLKDYYKSNQKTQKSVSFKTSCKPNHCKTECKICKNYFYMHKKRLALEVRAFRQLNLLWSCRKCRTHDVKSLCRDIRNS